MWRPGIDPVPTKALYRVVAWRKPNEDGAARPAVLMHRQWDCSHPSSYDVEYSALDHACHAAIVALVRALSDAGEEERIADMQLIHWPATASLAPYWMARTLPKARSI
jgi:hypothetical protein